ncbi:hypothetical protein BD310DRAFT_1003650, partial [Dichomitus squalens]
RHVAGPSAWRPSDANFNPTTHAQESSGWEPEYQAYPSQPDCDSRSIAESHSPRFSLSPASPGSPGQWSQESLSPGGDPHLIATPCLIPHGRRGSVGTDVSENEGDYFSHSPNSPRETRQNFGNFLEHANKTTARDQKHAPDPFLDAAPTRPFGAHSRVSSVESIVSIVDEKQNSPLNKRSLRYVLEGVASEFVQKLQMLNAHNSKHELSIKKYLMKSEEAFFDKVKKDKLSSAASIRLSQRYSVWGTPVASTFDHSRPSSPSNTSFAASGMNLSDDNGVVIMTGLPIALSREVFGWPLYTIIIALGQTLAATSFQITLLSGQNLHAATWAYAVASAAAFCFFGLNFGEEAGAATEVLDVTCVCRPGFLADLGRCPVVLGLQPRWRRLGHPSAMVDRAHRLASGCYELTLRLPHALRLASLLPSDAAQGTKLLENAVPQEDRSLVPWFGDPARPLAQRGRF